MTAIQPLLNGPMFFEAHRLSIFTPRALDVDVVLDLMIHDLDIVLKLANSPVREVRAVGLPILSKKVDIANVRLEFESGCVANFTASRVSTELVRKLRFFQPHQYVSIDYARKDLLIIDVAADVRCWRKTFAWPQLHQAARSNPASLCVWRSRPFSIPFVPGSIPQSLCAGRPRRPRAGAENQRRHRRPRVVTQVWTASRL